MEKEVKILEAFKNKIEEVEQFDTNGDNQMERYKEGLLTAYHGGRSIAVSIFKEFCRNENCDESNCKICTKYDLM